MKTKSVETKSTSMSKVKFTNSMGYRISMLLSETVILTVIVILIVLIPEMSSNISTVTKSNMLNMAELYSQVIDDSLIKNGGMLLDPSAMKKILQNEKTSGDTTTYAYVVASNGTMRWHPTEDKIGQPVENAAIKNVVAKLQAGEEVEASTCEYDFNGDEKYAAYSVGTDGSYVVVVTSDKSTAMQAVASARTKCIVIAAILYIAIVVVSSLLIKRLMSPLSILTNRINKYSELNFVSEKDDEKYNSRKDEMGLLSRSVNNLRSEISATVSVVKTQSRGMSTANSEFGEKFNGIAETIKDVNKAVEEMAQGSTNQAGETAKANENVTDIGSVIDRNMESINALNASCDQMTEYAGRAVKTIGELVTSNTLTTDNIEHVTEQTIEANNSAQNIKEAVSLIQNIAQQTNLLSLNASIEAARAGEAGKGFSVVAQEIRKLSEDSENSAREIDEIAKELMDRSNENAEKMKVVNEYVTAERKTLDDTSESFNDLKNEVDKVYGNCKEILAQTGKLGSLKDSVRDIVEQLAAISEENAASTEETSASMNALADTIVECLKETDSLESMSRALSEKADRFRITEN